MRQLEGEAARVEVDGDQRRSLARDQAALLVDRLLAPVTRGRGALDLAIGEGLGALSAGDRTLRLGDCSIGDYARERLGLPARSAQAMAQLSPELREKPLLRQAVLCGEVSASRTAPALNSSEKFLRRRRSLFSSTMWDTVSSFHSVSTKADQAHPRPEGRCWRYRTSGARLRLS